MNITDALRQDDLQPVAILTDHFHCCTVGELGKSGMVKPCPGTDIQPAAVGGDCLSLSELRILRTVGIDLDTVLGNGDVTLAPASPESRSAI